MQLHKHDRGKYIHPENATERASENTGGICHETVIRYMRRREPAAPSGPKQNSHYNGRCRMPARVRTRSMAGPVLTTFNSCEMSRMDFRRRFRLFLNVVAIVAILIAVKFAIHFFHVEFLGLDTLFSSIVAGTIFIIGFLLTGLLPDFKEAERMPAEIRTALEAIHDDVAAFSRQVPAVHVGQLTSIVLNIVDALEKGLGNEGGHAHLEAAIAQADKLVPYIAELERLGMSQNFVVRIRGELDVLRKCLYRVYYIQRDRIRAVRACPDSDPGMRRPVPSSVPENRRFIRRGDRLRLRQLSLRLRATFDRGVRAAVPPRHTFRRQGQPVPAA